MSNANFQSIVTKLVVSAASMDKGLQEGEAKANGFASRVQDIFKTATGGAFGGIGDDVVSSIAKLSTSPAAAVGVLVGGFTKMAGAIDEADAKALSLEKSARRLGVSLPDRAAFDVLVGIDKGEEAANQFGRWNKLVGEAKLGNEEARKTISQLGLSLESLSKMTGGQQIEAFATALANMSDHQMRAAISSSVLGKSWQDTFEIVNKIGAGGLTRARQFAEDSGYIPSAEQIGQGKDDARRNRELAIRAAGRANRMAETWRTIDEISDKLSEGWADVKDAISNTLASFPGFRKIFQTLKGTLPEPPSTTGGISSMLPELFIGIAKDAMAGGPANRAAALRRIEEEANEAADALLKMMEAQQEYTERIDQLTTELADPMQKVRDNFAFAQSAFNAGDIGAGTLGRSFAALERGLGLSANNPAYSTLASGFNLNSFEGQKAAQMAAARGGGADKTIEERIEAVNQKLAEESKKQTDYQKRLVDALESSPVILAAPGLG